MAAERDQIDALTAQWQPEHPDLDLATMARVGRLLAVARAIEAGIAAQAAEHGVDVAEGDVLFTLRRAGTPYRLSPSEISAALLVSSGTLTSRLDRLEGKGLIKRVPHPSDRRSVEVELTPAAVKLADKAVHRHVDNERRMLAPLSEREQAQLDGLLRKLLAGFSEPSAGS
jgi:DNA-binding MarR family transcriptional regulator